MKKTYESPEFDVARLRFDNMLSQITGSDNPDPHEGGDHGEDD